MPSTVSPATAAMATVSPQIATQAEGQRCERAALTAAMVPHRAVPRQDDSAARPMPAASA